MILKPFLEKARANAWTETLDCTTRHDVPADAPADLRDTNGWFDYTKSGHLVAGRLMPADVGRGADEPVQHLFIAIYTFGLLMISAILAWSSIKLGKSPLVPVGTVMAIGLGLAFVVLSLRTFATVATLILIAPFTLGLSPALYALFGGGPRGSRALFGSRTATLLYQARKLSGNSVYLGDFWNSMALRTEQAQEANKDKSAFITLGSSTGQFYGNLDPLAAQGGLKLGLTAGDLSTHLVVFGATGTGKTAGVLRPVARQWSESKAGGLLVLDGKGDLPREMQSLPDFQLIEPGVSQLALLEGLIAEDVVDALVSISAAGSSGGRADGDDFWTASGQAMLRAAALLLEHADDKAKFPWSLSALHQVVNEPDYRGALIASLKDHPDVQSGTGSVALAASYWLYEYTSYSANTSASIVATVNSWINPVLGHRELLQWSQATTGADPSTVLTGGRMGISVPAYRYGSAGAVVSALVKQRVYRAVRRRGSSWKKQAGQTPILLLIDEAQEVLGSADMDMWPVARSLGLAGVIATQSADEIVARFGEKRALAMLNNFRSIVSYKSSEATMAYVCTRLGHHLRLSTSLRDNRDLEIAAPQFGAIVSSEVVSPLNDPHHRAALRGGVGAIMRNTFASVKDIVAADGDGNAMQTGVAVAGARIDAPVMSAAEASQLLERRWHAVAVLNRAGITRRDVIRTHPEFPA